MTTLIKHTNGQVTLQTNCRIQYIGNEPVEAVDVTELSEAEQLDILKRPEQLFAEPDKAYKKKPRTSP